MDIPAEFQFQGLPSFPPLQLLRKFTVPSNGHTFNQHMPFRIPIESGRANGFLDPRRCYLEMTITIFIYNDLSDTTKKAALQMSRAGIASIIQTFRFLINGRPVEEIEDFNFIAETLYATRESIGDSNIGSITRGRNAKLFCNENHADKNSFFYNTAVGQPEHEASFTFAMPILSGFLGNMAVKAFPLLLFPTGSLEIEIEPTEGRFGLVSSRYTGIQFKLTNIRLHYDELIVSPEISAAVLQSVMQGKANLATRSMKTYITTIPAGVSSHRQILPIRLVNCDTLLFAFRPLHFYNSVATNQGFKLSRSCPENFIHQIPIGSEVRTNGSFLNPVADGSFQIYIGSDPLFPEAWNSSSQFAAEVMVAFQDVQSMSVAFGAEFSFGTGQSWTNYYADENSGFLIGVDLSRYSNTDIPNSGMNFSGKRVTYEIRNANSTHPLSRVADTDTGGYYEHRIGGGLRVHTIAIHHIRLNLLPGGAVIPTF